MKALLADRKIQKMISTGVAVMIIAIIMVLVIIPGVQNSQFTKLKKYDEEKALGEALKHKQAFANNRYYQMMGCIESADAQIFRIGDFTVNVRGYNQQKLVLNISVQYSNSALPAELQDKNPLVRNAIIAVTSDAQYIKSMRGKELLKENLKRELNTLLSEGEITEVYFNRFLIQ
jgi:flagellar basal body-associated protein FliL